MPDDSAVRITAHGGLGSVDLPATFARVSGEGREGTWETAGFTQRVPDAETTVTIDYNGGAGGLTVR